MCRSAPQATRVEHGTVEHHMQFGKCELQDFCCMHSGRYHANLLLSVTQLKLETWILCKSPALQIEWPLLLKGDALDP